MRPIPQSKVVPLDVPAGCLTISTYVDMRLNPSRTKSVLYAVANRADATHWEAGPFVRSGLIEVAPDHTLSLWEDTQRHISAHPQQLEAEGFDFVAMFASPTTDELKAGRFLEDVFVSCKLIVSAVIDHNTRVLHEHNITQIPGNQRTVELASLVRMNGNWAFVPEWTPRQPINA